MPRPGAVVPVTIWPTSPISVKPGLRSPGQALLTRRTETRLGRPTFYDDSVGQSELSGWVFVFLAKQRDAAEGDPYEAQKEERACMGR